MKRQMPEAEVVLDGYNGYLFDYGSAMSLSQTLIQAVDKSIYNFSENCHRSVRKYYTPEYQAKVFWKVIDTLKN
tara:strand:+ start:1083 stop:1304 length:222 start_codon:yes stop_codon:yes gene_type:complete